MKVLVVVSLMLLALLGAGGMSSLQDDDFCSTNPRAILEEGGSYGSEVKWLPPGWRCTYEFSGGSRVVESGSWSWFVVAVAGELLVAAWFIRRRSRPARLAATSTVALASIGALALLAGFRAFGSVFFVGMPLAWLADFAIERDPRQNLFAALAAVVAAFVTAAIALYFGDRNAVAACFAAVALVAAAAALAEAMLRAAGRAVPPRPAR